MTETKKEKRKVIGYLNDHIAIEKDFYNRYKELLAVLIGGFVEIIRSPVPYKEFELLKYRDGWLIGNSYSISKLADDLLTANFLLTGAILPLNPNDNNSHMNILNNQKALLLLKFNDLVNKIYSKFLALITFTGVLAIVLDDLNKESIEGTPAIADFVQKTLSDFIQISVSQSVSGLVSTVAESQGYTQYIAGNVGDERVRPQHEIDNDGVTWHNLDDPPKSDLPGVQVNCRCGYLFFR